MDSSWILNVIIYGNSAYLQYLGKVLWRDGVADISLTSVRVLTNACLQWNQCLYGVTEIMEKVHVTVIICLGYVIQCLLSFLVVRVISVINVISYRVLSSTGIVAIEKKSAMVEMRNVSCWTGYHGKSDGAFLVIFRQSFLCALNEVSVKFQQ